MEAVQRTPGECQWPTERRTVPARSQRSLSHACLGPWVFTAGRAGAASCKAERGRSTCSPRMPAVAAVQHGMRMHALAGWRPSRGLEQEAEAVRAWRR